MSFQIAVLSVIVIAVVVFALSVTRSHLTQRKPPTAPPIEPQPIPDAFPDFPETRFHVLCLRAGFRYIGEREQCNVHGILVQMRREGELLFARVPPSRYEETRSMHGKECESCGQRLYDLYVTGPQTLDPQFYGPCQAYRIGTVCGACARIQSRRRYDDQVPRNVEKLRLLLSQRGSAVSFINALSKTKTTP